MPSPDQLIAADIAELEQLLGKAKRPKVVTIISEYLASLRAELATRPQKAAAPAEKAPVPRAAPAAPAEKEPPPPRARALAPPPPVQTHHAPTPESAAVQYTSIASFGWDQDSYGKEPNFVFVYVTSGLDGVGDIKERVTCDFTESSFDLKILGLGGNNFRLLKKGLDKKIVPDESKVIVKKNRVTIKMKKVKGEYGYDQWMDLTAKHPKLSAEGKERDPGDSLMDMMKDLYNDGDENMKKALGEAMMKSREKQAMGTERLDDEDF
jgi:calcyclin binding protein